MEIKNIDLQRVIKFLEDLSFKGIGSIHRTKITNKLSEKLQEVAKGEEVIREDYKDDKDTLIKELESYFNETNTLEGDDIYKPLETIKKKVEDLVSEDSEKEFSGEEAYVLELLYDKLNIEENEDE